MLKRRGFLSGLVGLIAAPPLVRAASIMPVSVQPLIPITDPNVIVHWHMYGDFGLNIEQSYGWSHGPGRGILDPNLQQISKLNSESYFKALKELGVTHVRPVFTITDTEIDAIHDLIRERKPDVGILSRGLTPGWRIPPNPVWGRQDPASSRGGRDRLLTSGASPFGGRVASPVPAGNPAVTQGDKKVSKPMSSDYQKGWNDALIMLQTVLEMNTPGLLEITKLDVQKVVKSLPAPKFSR